MGGRETSMGEGSINPVASQYVPGPGIKPATQACALMGNQTLNPSVTGHSNQLSHTSQGSAYYFNVVIKHKQISKSYTLHKHRIYVFKENTQTQFHSGIPEIGIPLKLFIALVLKDKTDCYTAIPIKNLGNTKSLHLILRITTQYQYNIKTSLSLIESATTLDTE